MRSRDGLAAARLALAAALLALPAAANAAATPWVGDAHARARLITAEAATGSSSRLDAGLEIVMAHGWHAYWRTPGDAGLPPSIDWTGSDNLAAATIAWPAPVRLVLNGLQNAIYPDHVVLPISVALAQPGRPARLHADVSYAACAEICVPYHAVLDLAVPAGLAVAAPEAPLIAEFRARVPGGLDQAGLRLLSAVVAPARSGTNLAVTLASDAGPLLAPDLFIEGIDQIAPPRPMVRLAPGGRSASLIVALPGLKPAAIVGKPLTFSLVDGARAAEFIVAAAAGALPADAGARALPAILAVALLAGLVLNAMPCVLPVLSLKLLAVTAHAGQGRRRVRAGLLATAAGVVVSFALLAAALVGLRVAGVSLGWGIQFQQPWFLAAMAAVTTLFAASLWDWLPIALPGMSAAAGVQSRRPLLDSFLTGVFATLLATPCSAPFLGTAIGFALARGPGDIAAVFTALGLGMAAPYLLVAAIPRLALVLPRPGAWMVALRRALGMLLAGTAAWLLWVLAAVVSPQVALFAAAALALAVAMLAWRSRGGAAMGGRLLGPATALAAALAVLVPALAEPAAPSDRAVVAAPGGAVQWRRFDAAAIAPIVAQGKVVFINVTADWCLTCKLNKAAVLDRDPVAARLRGADVVAMVADWTRSDPAITAYLQSFGRYGVPLDVVYGPGRPQGVALPELLSARAVTDAITQAAGPLAAEPAPGGLAAR